MTFTNTNTDPHTGPAVVADRLSKRYGRTTAVDDLSFTVRPGAVTGEASASCSVWLPTCAFSGGRTAGGSRSR
jgi:hypothetical protein